MRGKRGRLFPKIPTFEKKSQKGQCKPGPEKTRNQPYIVLFGAEGASTPFVVEFLTTCPSECEDMPCIRHLRAFRRADFPQNRQKWRFFKKPWHVDRLGDRRALKKGAKKWAFGSLFAPFDAKQCTKAPSLKKLVFSNLGLWRTVWRQKAPKQKIFKKWKFL